MTGIILNPTLMRNNIILTIINSYNHAALANPTLEFATSKWV